MGRLLPVTVAAGVVARFVDHAGGEHFLAPELQGLHRDGDALEFLLDKDEVLDLVFVYIDFGSDLFMDLV